MGEIAFRSARELLAAIREQSLSSRELLECFLERQARYGSRLNAIVTLDATRARREADAADRALARGRVLGPLHGLPMTVKDTFQTEGLRTTAGVRELGDHVPATDAVAVARLRAAGAVIFGKTNTPPWAADWQTRNTIFGTTCNPFDHDRAPGGSSGGSAAALAAGLTGLELGSDLGGSIRVPAHWSGVCGHKPSHGLVPQRGHIPGPPGTLAEADLNVVGPLARRVEDLELAFDVLAGTLPADAVAWRLGLPPARRDRFSDFRVAVWIQEPSCPIDAEMKHILEKAISELRAAGSRIDETHPDVDFRKAVEIHLQLMIPLNTRFQKDEEFRSLLEEAEKRCDTEWSTLAAQANVERHRDWLASHERRERIRMSWAEFFRDYDVLLCPVSLTPAIFHDDRPLTERTVRVNDVDRSYMEQVAWPGLVSMALLPATVIPVGRTSDGMPVGMQIVGPHLEDRTPLRFARGAEDVLGGFEAPPNYA